MQEHAPRARGSTIEVLRITIGGERHPARGEDERERPLAVGVPAPGDRRQAGRLRFRKHEAAGRKREALMDASKRGSDAAWIHPTAQVHPTAHVEPGAAVGPNSRIGPNVRVGSGTELGTGVILEMGVLVGRNARLSDGVVVNEGDIENDVRVGARTRLGGRQPAHRQPHTDKQIASLLQVNRYTDKLEHVVSGSPDYVERYMNTDNDPTWNSRTTVPGMGPTEARAECAWHNATPHPRGLVVKRGTEIGADCQVAGRVEIGTGCAIGDKVEIAENTVLSANVGIGESARLQGCNTIYEGTQVEPGTVVGAGQRRGTSEWRRVTGEERVPVEFADRIPRTEGGRMVVPERTKADTPAERLEPAGDPPQRPPAAAQRYHASTKQQSRSEPSMER